jgi:photosystem II stability/assembly factor-like uncharacterized protein
MPLRPLRLLAALLAAVLLSTACTTESGDLPDATEGADDTAATETTEPAATDEEEDVPRDSNEPEEPPEVNPLTGEFTKLSEPGVGGRLTSLAFDPDNPNRLFAGGDMLGIAVTGDFGETWDSTSGFASWEIGDINPNPSADGRLWAGSLSGPHASSDGGNTWELARNGMPDLSDSRYSLPIETILVDPTNGDHLLAFSGNQRNWDAPGAYANGEWQGEGSVWESTDSGATWARLATVAAAGNIRSAVFLGGNPDLLMAAVANRGVWTSTDAGATWVESAAGLPHFNTYDVASHPTDPNIAWVALGEGPLNGDTHVAGGIWATTDGGANWTAVNNGIDIVANNTAGNTGSFHQIVSAPTDPNRLYTSNVAPGQAAVYRSDDGGQNWFVIADGSTIRPNAYESALRAFDIAVHPADADRIAIGSDDTLLGSVDGGGVWQDLTTLEDSLGFFAGRGYTGLVSTDIVFSPTNPDELILLGFDGGNFIQTIDGGETWRRTVQPISKWGGAIEAAHSPSNPDRIYVLLGQFSNFRGLAISDDGGATFTLAVGPDVGLPAAGNVDGGATGLAVLDSNGSDFVFIALGQILYRSEDGGQSFTPVDGLGVVRDVAVDADGFTVHVANSTSVLESTDAGGTFETLAGSPAGITTLYSSESEPEATYAVAFRDGEGGAYRYDGQTWTRIFTDQYAHGIAIDPTNPANLAIVTSEPAFHDVSFATGVHLSNDGGQTWTVMNDGLPMTRLRTADFDPHNPDRLVVGTTGRGFYNVSFSQALG